MKNRILFILCFLATTVFSQVYTLKNYTEDDGLPQSFINDITQDKNGFLFVATGNGLASFDGNKFKSFKVENGLPNNLVTSIYVDHENKIWTGHTDGGVAIIRNNNTIQNIKFKEEVSARIIQILEISTNNYLLLKKNVGLILYNEQSGAYTNIENELFNEVLNVFIQNGEILMLKPDGIYTMKIKDLEGKKYNLTRKITLVDAALMKLSLSTQNIIVADNSFGVLRLSNDGKFTSVDTFKITKNPGSSFTKLTPDRFSNIYVSSTDNGLYKINPETGVIQNYTIKNGLNSDAVQCLFIDREDNLLIGTYGNGLQQLNNELYSHSFISSENEKLSVNSSLKFHGKLVLASNKGIGYFDGNQINFISNPLLSNKNINCLMYFKNNFFFSSGNGNVFQSDTLFKKIIKIPLKTINQTLSINSLSNDGENILICSTSGLYIVKPFTYSYQLLNTEAGLLHNNVRFVFLDTKKHLWVCSPGTLIYYIDDYKDVKRFNEVPGLKNFNTNAVCEDKDGNIWISTIGDGVFKYNGRNFENYNPSNGLKSYFGYGIVCDYKGGVWVSHSNGISYKNKNKKNFEKIDGTTDLMQTLFIENSIFYDKADNEIIFGTNNGIVNINTTKQRFNEVEPLINFLNISLNDSSVAFFKDTILPYKAYDLTIDFVAVCLKDPTKVKYKYRLEGYTDKWEFANYETQKLKFPKLKDGEYTFVIYAANNDGLWTSNPVKFKFTIKKPFWKIIWFYVFLVAALFVIFVFLIKERTRSLTRKQKVLEEIIAQKTEEILSEKELIGKINDNLQIVLKDLKDSINYAKKIQSYILPDLNNVQKNLKTFLYFQPKDVVSGDYYGFYNVSKHKTIVFLIDCTGHGVPGAFLTVISKAFLNKIIIDKEIYEADEIIENLNLELRAFFDSQIEGEENKNFEGLVMSICVIDYPSKTVEYCGAGRPILYKIGNELHSHKGNLQSVGYDEDLPRLEVLKISFEKGLRVYLHSDGIQDQFGGENMKKFSSKRLIDSLQKYPDMPFDEECENAITEFLQWKDAAQQVDDICFFAFELFSGS